MMPGITDSVRASGWRTGVNEDQHPPAFTSKAAVLPPLVRVLEEAAGDEPWALIGASACAMQGAEADSPNLEFMTTADALNSLAEMLQLDAAWQQSSHLAAERLHFMRERVPVFVFANPVFHGSYDTLAPLEIPSLWDARVRVAVGGVGVLTTPLEWELLLSVILGMGSRVDVLRERMRVQPFDGRLLTRLLREGRVHSETEESVWAVLESDG